MDIDRIAGLIRALLIELGETPEREGLQDTPARVARFYQEFFNYDPGNTDTTFEAVQTDQLVIVKGIKVWSLCEHHLLPFYSVISIGYLCGNKVLGLSKFARIAQQFAHKLQLQERLVDEIAREIQEITGSPHVAVMARGEHLCMQMRGIRSDGQMITSVMLGEFRESASLRAEFLSLINS